MGTFGVAQKLDYPIMCAWRGLEGDYRHAAKALHVLEGWNVNYTTTCWVFLFALTPFAIFCGTFWPLRAWRLRALDRALPVKMLCNEDWLAVVSRGCEDATRSSNKSLHNAPERVQVHFLHTVHSLFCAYCSDCVFACVSFLWLMSLL
jgi:hypothetical protein